MRSENLRSPLRTETRPDAPGSLAIDRIQGSNLLLTYYNTRIDKEKYDGWVRSMLYHRFNVRLRSLTVEYVDREACNAYTSRTYVLLCLSSEINTDRMDIFDRGEVLAEVRTLDNQYQLYQAQLYLGCISSDIRIPFIQEIGQMDELIKTMQQVSKSDQPRQVHTIYCTKEEAHHFTYYLISESWKKYPEFDPGDFITLPYLPSLSEEEKELVANISANLKTWDRNHILLDLTKQDVRDNPYTVLDKLGTSRYHVWMFANKVYRNNPQSQRKQS